MKSSQTQKNISDNKQAIELACSEHFCLLIFDNSTFELKGFSNNFDYFFSESPKLGATISELFHFKENPIETGNNFSIAKLVDHSSRAYNSIITQDDNNSYVLMARPEPQHKINHLLNVQLSNQEALGIFKDKNSLYDFFLQNIRQIVDADQVAIFKFDAHKNWQVLENNNLGKQPSYKLMHFPASDWPPFIFEMLQRGIPYLAEHVQAEIKVISGESFSFEPNGLPIAAADEYTEKLWKNMQIGCIMLFPIKKNNQLWGTLSVMHHTKYCLSISEIAVLKQLCNGFGLQLQSTDNAASFTYENKTLYSLLENISKHQFPEKAIENNKPELLTLLKASGLSFFVRSKVCNYGNTPPDFITEEIKEKLLDDLQAPIYQTNNLTSDISSLQSFKSYASGLLAIKLGKDNKDFLVWYRPNNTKVLQWAGNPNANRNAHKPRRDFDSWVEVKTSGSLEWTDQDLFFAKEVGNHLSSLIKKQEKKEAEKKQMFELMFKHAPELIFILNDDFSVKYTSDSVIAAFGGNFEIATSDWKESVHPKDRKILIDYLSEVKNRKQTWQGVEYRIKDRDGKYIYLETFASNFSDNPVFKGILCSSRNTTSKVNALNRLAKFQKIIEKTNSAVLMIDVSRQAYPIIYTNSGIEHFTNLKSRTVVGRSWGLIDQHVEDNLNAAKFREAFRAQKAIETTLKMKHDNESKIWVRAQVSPLEENNQKGKLIIILSDISAEVVVKEKLKEYSEKLHLSNEELQTFAYVASHDLQEPLRTISGFSELFAEIYQDKIDQEANEYLTFILQATGRMKKLINDLLHFSRLSTEKGFIKEVNVAAVLQRATDNLHTLIDENKAVITHDLLPNIFVNETLLLQVFQNLISNAIKYRSDAQPKIHITAKYKKKSWVFGVQDNGIGISRKYYDRIFIIFQRLHTSDKYSGTGIGLAICKKIIEKYGGRIWVASEEGKGSTFYFTIPDILTLS